MQRRDTPTIKTPVGSSIHSAKDHNDTSEGAVHWFQDESGKGLRDSTLFKNLSLLIFYDNHFKKKSDTYFREVQWKKKIQDFFINTSFYLLQNLTN